MSLLADPPLGDVFFFVLSQPAARGSLPASTPPGGGLDRPVPELPHAPRTCVRVVVVEWHRQHDLHELTAGGGFLGPVEEDGMFRDDGLPTALRQAAAARQGLEQSVDWRNVFRQGPDLAALVRLGAPVSVVQCGA
jgi:hypothetical protein